ncbi:MAG: hypothetical protein M3025_06615 [Actinomycetota bacterium]|nr:hypothetical protein [Actinomycetota bacterium]
MRRARRAVAAAGTLIFLLAAVAQAAASGAHDYSVSGLGKVVRGYRYEGLITGQLSAAVQTDSLTVILTPPGAPCPLNSDRAEITPGAVSVALLLPGSASIHALLRSTPLGRKGLWHVCTYLQGVVDPNTVPDQQYFTTFQVVRGRPPKVHALTSAPDYTVHGSTHLRRGHAYRGRVTGTPPQALQSDTFAAVLIPPGLDCPQNSDQAAQINGSRSLALEFFNQSPFQVSLFAPGLRQAGIWSLCTYLEGVSNPNTVPDEFAFITVKVVRSKRHR